MANLFLKLKLISKRSRDESFYEKQYSYYYWYPCILGGLVGCILFVSKKGQICPFYERWENESSPTGPYFVEARILTGFTLLHGAAYLGIVEIFAGVLEMKEWDVNATGSAGSTTLTWAASKGYEDIAKILLERDDVNLDQAATENGRMPLSWAAKNGHQGIVKMLLEREEVNPDHPDTKLGQTPPRWRRRMGMRKL